MSTLSAAAPHGLRVLIVDDHRMVREWLRTHLSRDGSFVVREAASVAEATAEARRWPPDVLILDLVLPDGDGSEVCEQVLRLAPEAVVIVLSAYADAELVREAVRAGAHAYLLKDVQHLDVPNVIGRVRAGESVLDPRVAGFLLRDLGGEQRRFSEQELKILRLVAEGFTNPEIGARLYLSRHTVKEYLSNAMSRLEVTTRVEAVLEATRRGLIEPSGRAHSPRPLSARPIPRLGPREVLRRAE